MIVDSEFKNIIYKIIRSWNHNQNFPSIQFYEGNFEDEFNGYLQKLSFKYNCVTEELLNSISNALLKSGSIHTIDFMLRFGNFVKDVDRLVIVKYLFSKFGTEMKKYQNELLDYLYRFNNSSTNEFIECIDVFTENNLDLNKINLICDRINILIRRYQKSFLKMRDLERENKSMKDRIKELELQIQYMPGGDGYLEAKENFKKLIL